MKINKNKTYFSSVSPAFVGPYVPLAPVSRAERQRCTRTALSEVTHDLWLSTPKAVPRLWPSLLPLLPGGPTSPRAASPRAQRHGAGTGGRPSFAAADLPLKSGLRHPVTGLRRHHSHCRRSVAVHSVHQGQSCPPSACSRMQQIRQTTWLPTLRHWLRMPSRLRHKIHGSGIGITSAQLWRRS